MVEFFHLLGTESYVGGKLKSIRVVRYGFEHNLREIPSAACIQEP